MSNSNGILFRYTINCKVGYHEIGDEKMTENMKVKLNRLPNGQGKFTFPQSTQKYVGAFK